jgi:3',5'-cyclic AMP phosphodiesterase CpdA
MASDDRGRTFADGAAAFPFVRVVGRAGRVALVGVNSAVPTPAAMAWGRIGREQLGRLAGILDRLAAAGLFRLVAIHHPPLPLQASAARGLKDAPALEAVLRRHGAELMVHGHNHRNMLAWIEGKSGTCPVVGTPSASLGRRHGREPLARYNLFRTDAANRGIELIGRGLTEPGGPVVEIERRMLLPKQQP